MTLVYLATFRICAKRLFKNLIYKMITIMPFTDILWSFITMIIHCIRKTILVTAFITIDEYDKRC